MTRASHQMLRTGLPTQIERHTLHETQLVMKIVDY